MRDEAKKKSELIKELQSLRDKNSSLESALKMLESGVNQIEAAKATEEHYRLISENSGDVIWLFDLDKGKFSYVSPSVQKLRGYTPEEIAEQTMRDALTDESFNYVMGLLPARISVFENGDDSVRVLTNEVDQHHKDGSVIHTEVVTTLVKNLEGNVKQILGVTRNITERKLAEKALAEKDKLYRALFDLSPSGIILQDSEGNIIDVNAAACITNGYSKEELVGKNIRILVPAAHHKDVDAHIARLLAGEKLEHEVENVLKDGSFCIMELRESAIQLPDGTRGFISITNDISERKRTEAALQKSEDRFRKFFEEDLAANFVSTVDGTLIKCNTAFIKMFKFESIEEALRFNASTLYEAVESRNEFLELLRSNGKIVNHEFNLLRRDGKLIRVIENVVGHFDESGELVEITGYLYDQTDRKHSEELIKASEEKFNKSFHSSPIAMTIQTSDVFVDVNETFLAMMEFDRDDIVGHRGEDLNLWANENERTNAQIQFRTQGFISNFEFNFRTKSGNIGTGIIWAEPIVISGEASVLTTTLNITDRKLVEAALKESEEKYRDIFNQAPVGIYQSTTEGKLLGVNERLVQILGYDSKEELITRDIGNDIYWNKEDRKNTILNYETGGKVADIDLCWKKKDGTPIWIQLTAHSIKNSAGSTIYYEGFVRDVSERNDAEAKLRENQKLLSTVIETMPIGIWMIDRTGQITHGNSAAQQIWGGIKYVGLNDYGEYTGWFTNTGKKVEAADWGAARALRTGDTILNEEIEIECFDKTHKYINHSAVPIRNSKKEITGVVVLNQDITEQKSKELQIRKLSSAVEQSTISVMITDLKGKIEYVNRKFLESTGYSLEEIIGKYPSILKSGFTSADEYKKMWETISAGNEWRGEFLNRTKDGSTIWEFEIISPIRNNSGAITNYLAIKEDISNQKKMTAELISAKEHAEHSDNLKTEFIAQMSHEIRTPLNILLSFSNFIKEELEDKDQITEELEEYFYKVNNAGARIIRTIELILNMSEIQSGSYANDPKPTDIVNDILNNTYHKFHQLVDEDKLQFELIRNSTPLQSNIDQYSVEQIFIHLLENAVKFTEEGHIKIHVDKNEMEKPVVKIEDTGIGIGEEYLKYLYSPFSQEEQGYSRSFEGNGLGLALVKRYCDLNKIQISVQSEKGKGTVFTLVFP